MLERNGAEYLDGDLLIRPLIVTPETHDDMDLLAEAYIRIKREGLLPYLCSQHQPDIANFMQFYLFPGSLTLGAFRLYRDVPELMGFSHLEKPVDIGGGHQKSVMHFCFFREFQDRNWTLRAARTMLEWAFDRTILASVHGYTAAPNKAMIRLAKMLGFRQTTLPDYTTNAGEVCDVVVTSFTRRMWEARKPV